MADETFHANMKVSSWHAPVASIAPTGTSCPRDVHRVSGDGKWIRHLALGASCMFRRKTVSGIEIIMKLPS
jgi:hypothetical protein